MRLVHSNVPGQMTMGGGAAREEADDDGAKGPIHAVTELAKRKRAAAPEAAIDGQGFMLVPVPVCGECVGVVVVLSVVCLHHLGLVASSSAPELARRSCVGLRKKSCCCLCCWDLL